MIYHFCTKNEDKAQDYKDFKSEKSEGGLTLLNGTHSISFWGGRLALVISHFLDIPKT